MVNSHSIDDRPGDLARALVGVFLFAILVRLVYFFEHMGSPGFGVPLLDQLYYHLFAQAIVEGEDLRQFAGFRPVLYPFMLSSVYRLTGAAGPIAAIFGQHLLGAATSVLVGVLAWFGSGRKPLAAIAGGVLYALASPPLFYEGELLIATVMAFLCAAQLTLIAVALASGGKRAAIIWFLAGCAGALAAQARPNIILFFPAYLLVAGIAIWRERSPASFKILWALLGIVLIQVAFGFVNKSQSGRFQLVTSAGGINFYVGNNSRADGMIPKAAYSTTYEGEYKDSIAVFAEVEYRRLMDERSEKPSDDPGTISDFWMEETWREVRAQPGRWVLLMLKKSVLAIGNYEISNGESFAFSRANESTVLKLLPTRWWLLMLLAPLGIAAFWRSGSRSLLLFLILFLGLYSLSFILFFVNSRFRIPLWPVMAAFGGAGVSLAWDAYSARRLTGLRVQLAAGAALATASLMAASLVPAENYSRPYYFRSLASFQTGQYKAALADIQHSIELEEATGDILLHLGNVYFAMDQPEQALDAYEKAALLEPFEPRIYNNIGAVKEAAGDFDGAYTAYLRALELVPGHRTALVNAALLELRGGLHEKARAHLETARASISTGNDLYLLCAEAFLSMEDDDRPRAEELLDQAAELDRGTVTNLVEEYGQKITLLVSDRNNVEFTPPPELP